MYHLLRFLRMLLHRQSLLLLLYHSGNQGKCNRLNAPLVPDPSSREITSIVPLAALAVAANAVVPISAAVTIAKIFFFMIKSPLYFAIFNCFPH